MSTQLVINSVEPLPDLILSNNAEWNEAFDIIGLTSIELIRCKAYMQLRVIPESVGVYLDKSTAYDGGMKLDPVAKTMVLRVSAPLPIPVGLYVRDILIVMNGRDSMYAGRGSVQILQGVTALRSSRWPHP